MLLTSSLFRDDQKLQDCASLDSAHLVADEPPLRRAQNAQGPHVALIHRALRRVMPGASFGLEEATETYGPKTAEVVRQFKAKQNPPILNKALRQTTPDNIVGKQTILALDQQVGRSGPVPPPPDPSPETPPATGQRLVSKTTFEDKFVDKPPGDLSPDSGGIGFAIGTAIKQGVNDVLRLQKNPIEGTDFDDGVVRQRSNAEVPAAHVMKTVNIVQEVRQMPSLVTFGAKFLRFNITRAYRYTYGVGQPSDLVLVSTIRTIIAPGRDNAVLRDSRSVRQPSSTLDPR